MKNLRFIRAGTLLRLVVVSMFSLRSASAPACSMCRCGDPTFNALGTDVYTPGRFRLALDWERFDKENGVSEIGSTAIIGRDQEVENRVTATVAYSFGETATVVARVPFSVRRLTTTDEDGSSDVTSTNGFSDPELYALVRLWSSDFAPGLGRRTWISAVAGVKMPWGRNDLRQNGVRVDEHAQSGTGSTDFFGGISAVSLLDSRSSVVASFQYRATGTNRFDYRYGNIATANVAYEHKLGAILDGVLELNWRHAQKDRIDADRNVDPNTGGDLLYVTPRVIVDLGAGFLARAAVQVPVMKSLYGDQKERVNVNIGLTFLF